MQQFEALERTHFLHAFFACIIDFGVNLCPIPVDCFKDCRTKIPHYTMLQIILLSISVNTDCLNIVKIRAAVNIDLCVLSVFVLPY